MIVASKALRFQRAIEARVCIDFERVERVLYRRKERGARHNRAAM